jgi:hypothetical protein
MMGKYVFRSVAFLCVTSVGLLFVPVGSFAQESDGKIYELDAGLYYTIQKGDTLWDLSQHFFDSPWVWPDLWGKNKEIPNPHWIYPGNRIQVFGRKGTEEILNTAPSPEPTTAQAKEEEPSFYLFPAIDSVGFVRKEPLVHWGIVFKVKEDKEMISVGDLVYVRPAGQETFKPGDRFTIFRTLDTLEDKETDTPIGVQHYVVGVLEISDVEPRFSTGKIIKSFRHIEINDLLTPYKPRSEKIKLTESAKEFNGKIVGSEENAEIIGDQDLVFVDKGQDDGIKLGQCYSIYYQDKEFLGEDEEEPVLLSPVDFGKILILHTERTTATALVTVSDKQIESGAKLRTPPR